MNYEMYHVGFLIDGFLSLTELQKCLEHVEEKLSMVGKIFVSHNALPSKNSEEIKISVLFNG